MVEYLLLDTDIGDDIDDAFALALALSEPAVKVVGVTTVFKNAKLRAMQVKALQKLFKEDFPVFYGEGVPYDGKIQGFENDEGDLQSVVPCQYDDGMYCEVEGGGVDGIIALAKKYSGKLVIAPIGPLTNVARAIEKDPSIIKDIKRIVTMGGWFTNNVPEWNILCDAAAADIVYSSGIPVYAVGLDVTLQCVLDGSLLDEFRKSQKPVNKILSKWLKKWFSYFNFEKSVMHDPLAIACATNGDICSFKKTFVKVDLEKNRGAICVSQEEKDGYSPIYVAESVDKDKFYAYVRKTLLG